MHFRMRRNVSRAADKPGFVWGGARSITPGVQNIIDSHLLNAGKTKEKILRVAPLLLEIFEKTGGVRGFNAISSATKKIRA